MLVHTGCIELRRDHFRYIRTTRCLLFNSCWPSFLTDVRFSVHFAETFLTVGISPCFEQRDEFHGLSTVDDTAHFRRFWIAFLLQKTLRNRTDDVHAFRSLGEFHRSSVSSVPFSFSTRLRSTFSLIVVPRSSRPITNPRNRPARNKCMS